MNWLSSLPINEDLRDRASDASAIFLKFSISSLAKSSKTETSGHIFFLPASSNDSIGKQTSSKEDTSEDLLEEGFDGWYNDMSSSFSPSLWKTSVSRSSKV
ncbi:unnamed protein product [[Candida] boidinii]|nr:unnamed protein product [[Candida] boidinii]